MKKQKNYRFTDETLKQLDDLIKITNGKKKKYYESIELPFGTKDEVSETDLLVFLVNKAHLEEFGEV
jgi:hypothetical protein